MAVILGLKTIIVVRIKSTGSVLVSCHENRGVGSIAKRKGLSRGEYVLNIGLAYIKRPEMDSSKRKRTRGPPFP